MSNVQEFRPAELELALATYDGFQWVICCEVSDLHRLNTP